MKRLLLLVILLAYISCESLSLMSQDLTKIKYLASAMSQNIPKIQYLALGDSYTIGEAVEQQESWPYRLTEILNTKGLSLEVNQVIATTGWTTDELLEAVKKEEADLLKQEFGLVSLLIGVNNQYRGYDIQQFTKEFEQLLQKALAFAGEDASKVFVVSIPDYGVTPFAKDNDKDIEKIATELINYNHIAQSISKRYNVSFYDITPISLKAIYDQDYVAKDGLHPSAKMYEEWVAYFSSAVSRQIIK